MGQGWTRGARNMQGTLSLFENLTFLQLDCLNLVFPVISGILPITYSFWGSERTIVPVLLPSKYTSVKTGSATLTICSTTLLFILSSSRLHLFWMNGWGFRNYEAGDHMVTGGVREKYLYCSPQSTLAGKTGVGKQLQKNTPPAFWKAASSENGRGFGGEEVWGRRPRGSLQDFQGGDAWELVACIQVLFNHFRCLYTGLI